MARVPTPAEVAGRLSSPPVLTSTELGTHLRRHFGGVARVCESIGIDVNSALQEWVGLEGPEVVTRWLTPTTPDHFLASDWVQRSQFRTVENVLAALVAEQQLSRRGQDIGSYLRSSGSSIAAAILDSRKRAADVLAKH